MILITIHEIHEKAEKERERFPANISRLLLQQYNKLKGRKDFDRHQ